VAAQTLVDAPTHFGVDQVHCRTGHMQFRLEWGAAAFVA
jgi:hypothetical protein